MIHLAWLFRTALKSGVGMFSIEEFAYAPFEALEEKGRTAKPIELEAKTTSKQKA